MSEHVEKEFHVENLKIFAGTKNDGFRMAKTTCKFYVEFHDGDTRFSGHGRG
jgi:hypothetical protein